MGTAAGPAREHTPARLGGQGDVAAAAVGGPVETGISVTVSPGASSRSSPPGVSTGADHVDGRQPRPAPAPRPLPARARESPRAGAAPRTGRAPAWACSAAAGCSTSAPPAGPARPRTPPGRRGCGAGEASGRARATGDSAASFLAPPGAPPQPARPSESAVAYVSACRISPPMRDRDVSGGRPTGDADRADVRTRASVVVLAAFAALCPCLAVVVPTSAIIAISAAAVNRPPAPATATATTARTHRLRRHPPPFPPPPSPPPPPPPPPVPPRSGCQRGEEEAHAESHSRPRTTASTGCAPGPRRAAPGRGLPRRDRSRRYRGSPAAPSLASSKPEEDPAPFHRPAVRSTPRPREDRAAGSRPPPAGGPRRRAGAPRVAPSSGRRRSPPPQAMSGRGEAGEDARGDRSGAHGSHPGRRPPNATVAARRRARTQVTFVAVAGRSSRCARRGSQADERRPAAL